MKVRFVIPIIVAGVLAPALAHAAEGGESKGTWGALFFYVVNFGLFVAILWRYAIPAIRKFFRDRATGIRETLSKADAAFREAEDLANSAAERAAKLEAEKNKIATDLADETVYQIGRIYDSAQEGAARIKRDNQLTIAALRENAARRVRHALAQAAGHFALEVVSRNFVPDDQARLLDRFVERLHDEAVR